MIKRIFILLFTTLILCMSSVPLMASNNIEQQDFVFDNASSIIFETSRFSSTVTVNKDFQLKLQNQSGTCSTYSTLNISGSYEKYQTGSTYDIYNVNIVPSIVSIPSNWQVIIDSSWTYDNSINVTVYVYYGSNTTDTFGCMVGGGYFYTTTSFVV